MDDYTMEPRVDGVRDGDLVPTHVNEILGRIAIAEKITSCINVSVFMICLTAIILALLLR